MLQPFGFEYSYFSRRQALCFFRCAHVVFLHCLVMAGMGRRILATSCFCTASVCVLLLSCFAHLACVPQKTKSVIIKNGSNRDMIQPFGFE